MKKMKDYAVCVKSGRSPYQVFAYAWDCVSPTEAIERFKATRPEGFDFEGVEIRCFYQSVRPIKTLIEII